MVAILKRLNQFGPLMNSPELWSQRTSAQNFVKIDSSAVQWVNRRGPRGAEEKCAKHRLATVFETKKHMFPISLQHIRKQFPDFQVFKTRVGTVLKLKLVDVRK